MIKSIVRILYTLNIEKIFQRLGIEETLRNKLKKAPIVEVKNKRQTPQPIKYIHIGYPKSASTALQRGFFGSHPQLLHLGCGNLKQNDFWDDHGYISSEINIAMEIDLRYKNELNYDPKATKSIFRKCFDQAENDLFTHAVGISNENLCFNWHGGIDTTIKAKRLVEIFGSDTKIIMVIRKQTDLIESLYKETVRFGYAGTFDDYLKYLWIYQDRNFLSDFDFSLIYQLYADLFDKENVGVFFFEEMQNSQKGFLENISDFLHLQYTETEINRVFNKQLSNSALTIKRQLNNKIAHSFERGYLNPFDTHRHVPYFTETMNEPSLDRDAIFDYHLRNNLNSLSEKLSTLSDYPPIELSWENSYGQKIKTFYNASNLKFHNIIGGESLTSNGYLEL
ncbi:MAG: hypothetical protein RIF33_07465 [Cyclobacteriaceae bacterium]